MTFEVKEELRWIWVLIVDGKKWGEYNTKDEVEAAIANIKHNEEWMMWKKERNVNTIQKEE